MRCDESGKGSEWVNRLRGKTRWKLNLYVKIRKKGKDGKLLGVKWT